MTTILIGFEILNFILVNIKSIRILRIYFYFIIKEFKSITLTFIGNDDSSKPDYLVVFYYLVYRNMMPTDVTAAMQNS